YVQEQFLSRMGRRTPDQVHPPLGPSRLVEKHLGRLEDEARHLQALGQLPGGQVEKVRRKGPDQVLPELIVPARHPSLLPPRAEKNPSTGKDGKRGVLS